MKIEISKIKVTKRIRKNVSMIDELAADIQQNGLINPIAVMPCSGDSGEYQLLAGLRRLRAVKLIGDAEIAATVIPVVDAEAVLEIEFSENEQRVPFVFSEKMNYALVVEKIEEAKAKERMSEGGKGATEEGVENLPHLEVGRCRDIIGKKIGMSGRQYANAKYVFLNAAPEIIEQIDKGEKSIWSAYDELRSQQQKSKTPTALPPIPNTVSEPPKPVAEPNVPVATSAANSAKPVAVHSPPAPNFEPTAPDLEPQMPLIEAPTTVANPPPAVVESTIPIAESAKPAVPKRKYNSAPDDFIRLFSEADHRCDTLETLIHNNEVQWNSEREGRNEYIAELEGQIAELRTLLDEAHAKIIELGGNT